MKITRREAIRATGGAIALGGAHQVGKIRTIELLGASGPLTWRQDEKELAVRLPPNSPARHAVVFKLAGV